MTEVFPEMKDFLVLKPDSPRQTQVVGFPKNSVFDVGYKAVKKQNSNNKNPDMVPAHRDLYNLVGFSLGVGGSPVITNRFAPFNYTFKSFVLDFITQ